ncbi:BLUF domain-containing protein [Polaribacter haliotis]|uniref:BLUF domain-containing protein n=1 Tax=Polaribacter haliotis TaxID=1888915 RepID=A0A7L8AEA9_9FLAO|nr:BLUF domain-containing protein [Polaribacter haliotis]QOD60322.1 BLUF domain-containing protein [Polaribacter haliotis]
MYQLNYHSKSIDNLSFTDLENILAEANTFNSSINITGCLIYHNNSFVQILEGEKKDVLEVFSKIKKDKRHHKVNVLWENKTDKRYFEEWNMAYYQPNVSNIKLFVNNLLLLSEFSEKSSGALLSFWANVKSVIGNGKINEKK